MNGQSIILHKTCTIKLMSYRRKIGWVPKAMVTSPSGEGGKDQTITGNPKELLATQEAADKVAEKLAIEWIDSQFPSASN